MTTEGNSSESGLSPTSAASGRPAYAVGAVLLGALLANLDTRIYGIALPDIRGAMGLSFDEGAWLNTAATASQIFIAPAVAWMATVFGLRRVLGVPALLYAVTSLFAPLIGDYHLLLLVNVLRGLLLGTFVPATLLIIFRFLPVKWWLPAIAIYCARVGFTVNSGVWLAGYYVEQEGWQWLFWQDCILAPLLAILTFLGTPEEAVDREVLRHADWSGMLLLGTAMAMVYAGIDQANRLDWTESLAVTGLLAVGAIVLLCFFVNEAVVERPWADIKVVFSRNVGLALLAIVSYSIACLSNSMLAPNFLGVVPQLRPDQSGVLFLVYAVMPMILLVPLSILLVRRHDARLPILVGLSAFAASGYMGTRLTHDWSLDDFTPMVLLQSVGQSFTLMPIVVIALSNTDPKKATAFAAYIQVMRLGSAEIGIAAMSTWLRVRENFHSNMLGQNIAIGDGDVGRVINRLNEYFDRHGAIGAKLRSLGTIAAMVQREANTLSYIDGFWLTFWAALAAMLAVSMIRRAPDGPFSPK